MHSGKELKSVLLGWYGTFSAGAYEQYLCDLDRFILSVLRSDLSLPLKLQSNRAALAWPPVKRVLHHGGCTMVDNRVDIKQSRCSSDANSGCASTGSHGRRRFPEKLIDRTRRVAGLGTCCVDNGAPITAGLANVVSKRACLLEMKLRNPVTGEHSVYWGQAGLIRAECLTTSPSEAENPRKRAARNGTDSESPAVEVPTPSSLRSSRFAAIPITCIHNLEDDVEDEVTWEFDRTEFTPVGTGTRRMFVINFKKTSYTAGPDESIVIQTGNAEEEEITWPYHDVTTAEKISNAASPLTRKFLSFPMVTRDGYELQVGQKIGIAVYRNFEINAADAGLPENSITAEELRQIFGLEGRVNIYTGEITNVSPGKEAFEHSINTFRGCSGAVIFLLDQGQEGCGVVESDYGKAIAVHVGGEELSNGTIVNFGFKIILE